MLQCPFSNLIEDVLGLILSIKVQLCGLLIHLSPKSGQSQTFPHPTEEAIISISIQKLIYSFHLFVFCVGFNF